MHCFFLFTVIIRVDLPKTVIDVPSFYFFVIQEFATGLEIYQNKALSGVIFSDLLT